MNTTPEKTLVSVVVVAYNSSKTILETLDSIFAQTYSPLELIIADDASTDDTAAIAREWIDAHRSRFVRTELVIAEKNGGISANCNRGCSRAQGDLMKSIAADDILLPNCITDNVDFMNTHPEATVVFSKIREFSTTANGEKNSQKNTNVYSKYIRKEDRAKLCAIPNPAEKSAETVAEKQNEILYVGRMTLSEKRVDLLLKVWAAVQNEFPEWRLTLVGGGRDEEKIREMSEKLKLNRISFEGFQKPEKYYARASIFCLTSAFEGFGLVLAEASAYGCVPVAFDSYLSAKDVIQSGENGFLIKAFDTNCYAEALRELMKNPPLRNRLSEAARVNADRFAPEKIVSRWEKLFKE